MAQRSHDAVVDMPAARIDEYRKEATDSRETVDFKTGPIPSEQSRAAKNADNGKAKQEAAVPGYEEAPVLDSHRGRLRI